MKNFIPIFVFALAFYFASNLVRDFINDGYGSASRKAEASVDAIQSKLPMKVDSATTLTAVRFADNAIEHDMQIDNLMLPASEHQSFQNLQRLSTIFSACLDLQISEGLDAGIDLKFNYTASQSDISFTNKITKLDCEPFKSTDKNALAEFYVNQQKQVLPMAVDGDTQWIDTQIIGSSINIIYQLPNFRKEDIDIILFEKYIEETIIPNMCKAPDFGAIMERGISYDLKYLDMHGDKIVAASFNKQLCLTI